MPIAVGAATGQPPTFDNGTGPFHYLVGAADASSWVIASGSPLASSPAICYDSIISARRAMAAIDPQVWPASAKYEIDVRSTTRCALCRLPADVKLIASGFDRIDQTADRLGRPAAPAGLGILGAYSRPGGTTTATPMASDLCRQTLLAEHCASCTLSKGLRPQTAAYCGRRRGNHRGWRARGQYR